MWAGHRARIAGDGQPSHTRSGTPESAVGACDRTASLARGNTLLRRAQGRVRLNIAVIAIGSTWAFGGSGLRWLRSVKVLAVLESLEVVVSRRGRPGAGASAQAEYRRRWRAGRKQRLLVRVVLSVAVFAVVTWAWDWRAGVLAAVVVAVGDMIERWRVHSPATAWRKGAIGERATARRLRSLESAGYTVLHDRVVPGSRANLDHLVIGRCGVVLVDSKRWHRNTRISTGKGRLWVGRRPAESVVKATVFEARRVGEVLRSAGWAVTVVPVVAVHGAKLPRWGALMVTGVTLLRAGRLRGWIRRHPARLEPGQVAPLSVAAEQLFPPYVPVEQP